MNAFDGISLVWNNPSAKPEQIHGLTETQILVLEGDLGFPFCSQLRDWMLLFGETMVGPGGISSVDAEMGIAARTRMHPEWLELGWVPLGGDWCGNYYVVATRGEPNLPEPVYFVDAFEDQDRPTYIAASNPAVFVRSLMARERGEIDWNWPFDKEKTLAIDPDIAKSTATMPWDA